MSDTKETTKKTGNKGEDIAVFLLKKKGYTIMKRNYTKKWGEIDVLAEKDEYLVVVEVKTRRGGGGIFRPEDQVTPHKRQQIKRVAQYLLGLDEYQRFEEVRFVVVAIRLERGKAFVRLLDDLPLE